MGNRTQIVCLHEGKKGHSVDPIFINRLIRSLNPAWIRPHQGNNYVRPVDCGNRSGVMSQLPIQLKHCHEAGGTTTLMVWADMDDNTANGDELKNLFWIEAQKAGVSRDEFDNVVFVFAEDRIENWIEFLLTGTTNEAFEGPRVTGPQAAEAARVLAKRCQQNVNTPPLPPSLEWSCRNWRKLVERMKDT